MKNINIDVIDLPLSVRGVTAIKNGTRYIFINGKYDILERNEILMEELTKIKDFSPRDFEGVKFKEGEDKK